MYDLEGARRRAEQYLQAEIRPSFDRELAIKSEFEFDGAWIFGWDSKEFLEDNTLILKAVIGNGPIVVERVTGDVWMAAASTPPRDQLVARGLARP